MKIMNQNQDQIIEMPKRIWITHVGDTWLIMHNSGTINNYLGTYDTRKRAQEVLCQLFEFYRQNNDYYMPKG